MSWMEHVPDLTVDDLMTSIEHRLTALYSVPGAGRDISILMQHGSKLEKVRNLSLALAFLRGETEYYASCRGLRGPVSSAAARQRKVNALRYLAEWLRICMSDGETLH